MREVSDDLEVFNRVTEDIFSLTLDDQARQRSRVARQLFDDLLDMIVVDVRVATRPDELADFQTALLCDHVGQQRIAGDVERHTEEHVRTPLVQLARQLAVDHVELEECVARHQRHPRQIRNVPGRDENSSRVRVVLELADDLVDLVVDLAVRILPEPPLNTVDRTGIAVEFGECIVLDHPLFV